MATRDDKAAKAHMARAVWYANRCPENLDSKADPQTIAAIATMHATIASMHLLADLNRRL